MGYFPHHPAAQAPGHPNRLVMYNYGYRYYHPELGRWGSRDPIVLQSGVILSEFTFYEQITKLTFELLAQEVYSLVNFYAMIGNNINSIDILGLIDCASVDDCGEDGANEAYDLTKEDKQKREFCGSVCCRNNKLFRTPAKLGTNGACDPSAVSPCPPDSKTVAIFHSHPTDSDFSYNDYLVADIDSSNYLRTPSSLRRVDKKNKPNPYGGKSPVPETYKRGNDKKYYPYNPDNNGLRKDMGLPPLNNGTNDPLIRPK